MWRQNATPVIPLQDKDGNIEYLDHTEPPLDVSPQLLAHTEHWRKDKTKIPDHDGAVEILKYSRIFDEMFFGTNDSLNFKPLNGSFYLTKEECNDIASFLKSGNLDEEIGKTELDIDDFDESDDNHGVITVRDVLLYFFFIEPLTIRAMIHSNESDPSRKIDTLEGKLMYSAYGNDADFKFNFELSVFGDNQTSSITKSFESIRDDISSPEKLQKGHQSMIHNLYHTWKSHFNSPGGQPLVDRIITRLTQSFETLHENEGKASVLYDVRPAWMSFLLFHATMNNGNGDSLGKFVRVFQIHARNIWSNITMSSDNNRNACPLIAHDACNIVIPETPKEDASTNCSFFLPKIYAFYKPSSDSGDSDDDSNASFSSIDSNASMTLQEDVPFYIEMNEMKIQWELGEKTIESLKKRTIKDPVHIRLAITGGVREEPIFDGISNAPIDDPIVSLIPSIRHDVVAKDSGVLIANPDLDHPLAFFHQDNGNFDEDGCIWNIGNIISLTHKQSRLEQKLALAYESIRKIDENNNDSNCDWKPLSRVYYLSGNNNSNDTDKSVLNLETNLADKNAFDVATFTLAHRAGNKIDSKKKPCANQLTIQRLHQTIEEYTARKTTGLDRTSIVSLLHDGSVEDAFLCAALEVQRIRNPSSKVPNEIIDVLEKLKEMFYNLAISPDSSKKEPSFGSMLSMMLVTFHANVIQNMAQQYRLSIPSLTGIENVVDSIAESPDSIGSIEHLDLFTVLEKSLELCGAYTDSKIESSMLGDLSLNGTRDIKKDGMRNALKAHISSKKTKSISRAWDFLDSGNNFFNQKIGGSMALRQFLLSFVLPAYITYIDDDQEPHIALPVNLSSNGMVNLFSFETLKEKASEDGADARITAAYNLFSYMGEKKILSRRNFGQPIAATTVSDGDDVFWARLYAFFDTIAFADGDESYFPITPETLLLISKTLGVATSVLHYDCYGGGVVPLGQRNFMTGEIPLPLACIVNSDLAAGRMQVDRYLKFSMSVNSPKSHDQIIRTLYDVNGNNPDNYIYSFHSSWWDGNAQDASTKIIKFRESGKAPNGRTVIPIPIFYDSLLGISHPVGIDLNSNDSKHTLEMLSDIRLGSKTVFTQMPWRRFIEEYHAVHETRIAKTLNNFKEICDREYSYLGKINMVESFSKFSPSSDNNASSLHKFAQRLLAIRNKEAIGGFGNVLTGSCPPISQSFDSNVNLSFSPSTIILKLLCNKWLGPSAEDISFVDDAKKASSRVSDSLSDSDSVNRQWKTADDGTKKQLENVFAALMIDSSEHVKRLETLGMIGASELFNGDFSVSDAGHSTATSSPSISASIPPTQMSTSIPSPAPLTPDPSQSSPPPPSPIKSPDPSQSSLPPPSPIKSPELSPSSPTMVLSPSSPDTSPGDSSSETSITMTMVDGDEDEQKKEEEERIKKSAKNTLDAVALSISTVKNVYDSIVDDDDLEFIVIYKTLWDQKTILKETKEKINDPDLLKTIDEYSEEIDGMFKKSKDRATTNTSSLLDAFEGKENDVGENVKSAKKMLTNAEKDFETFETKNLLFGNQDTKTVSMNDVSLGIEEIKTDFIAKYSKSTEEILSETSANTLELVTYFETIKDNQVLVAEIAKNDKNKFVALRNDTDRIINEEKKIMDTNQQNMETVETIAQQIKTVLIEPAKSKLDEWESILKDNTVLRTKILDQQGLYIKSKDLDNARSDIAEIADKITGIGKSAGINYNADGTTKPSKNTKDSGVSYNTQAIASWKQDLVQLETDLNQIETSLNGINQEVFDLLNDANTKLLKDNHDVLVKTQNDIVPRKQTIQDQKTKITNTDAFLTDIEKAIIAIETDHKSLSDLESALFQEVTQVSKALANLAVVSNNNVPNLTDADYDKLKDQINNIQTTMVDGAKTSKDIIKADFKALEPVVNLTAANADQNRKFVAGNKDLQQKFKTLWSDNKSTFKALETKLANWNVKKDELLKKIQTKKAEAKKNAAQSMSIEERFERITKALKDPAMKDSQELKDLVENYLGITTNANATTFQIAIDQYLDSKTNILKDYRALEEKKRKLESDIIGAASFDIQEAQKQVGDASRILQDASNRTDEFQKSFDNLWNAYGNDDPKSGVIGDSQIMSDAAKHAGLTNKTALFSQKVADQLAKKAEKRKEYDKLFDQQTLMLKDVRATLEQANSEIRVQQLSTKQISEAFESQAFDPFIPDADKERLIEKQSEIYADLNDKYFEELVSIEKRGIDSGLDPVLETMLEKVRVSDRRDLDEQQDFQLKVEKERWETISKQQEQVALLEIIPPTKRVEIAYNKKRMQTTTVQISRFLY